MGVGLLVVAMEVHWLDVARGVGLLVVAMEVHWLDVARRVDR